MYSLSYCNFFQSSSLGGSSYQESTLFHFFHFKQIYYYLNIKNNIFFEVNKHNTSSIFVFVFLKNLKNYLIDSHSVA